ncbi:MAG: SidA/IucD/PvdA family monooxygenase [Acidimicrobiaceae bacterium]|nr:SidA/IucD/PvdA family monooxygenase [Acidimicrobiaceae bacterium]MYF41949.1 SidA/IucD/PvdA family monooxygenase [Acidimicrobiaceae bacterium]MYJ35221.1 SidA/IucD/PvdA family monooxygenase [Acidimicrobiaceae bacterium]
MSIESTDTVVVGGGQAGLAMSEHLSSHGVPHVVLERGRVAERWRSARWDSLVTNGPAWHDRFPGLAFDSDPDGFPSKEEVADYFVAYAQQIEAPVRCGVEVREVRHHTGRLGFRVDTSNGMFDARSIVAATGPFQQPVIPPVVPDDAEVMQLHSMSYRNPQQLPDGAVLVVGAGSSGVQIADELLRSGRRVFLSVGPHDRPPRSYRGQDYVWWLGVLQKWDAPAAEPGLEHVTISVSGAHGGHTVDFRHMAAEGIALVGMTQSFDNGVLRFAPDLGDNLARGDANYLSVLDEADAYIARNGLDLPAEPEARIIGPDPGWVTDPVLELDLHEHDVTSIIWATGYRVDYSWLKVDSFDETGRPVHHRGISAVPGIYFLGLPWQTRRGSSFIFGVWQDAKLLADHIASQNSYLTRVGAAQRSPQAQE